MHACTHIISHYLQNMTCSCPTLVQQFYTVGPNYCISYPMRRLYDNISGVSRGIFWLPGNPSPGHDFFIIRWVTPLLASTLPKLQFATFGNPPETNSGYATEYDNMQRSWVNLDQQIRLGLLSAREAARCNIYITG